MALTMAQARELETENGGLERARFRARQMQPTDSDLFEYVSDNRTLRCSVDHGKFSSPVTDFVQVFRSGSTSVSFVTLVFRA